MNPKVTGAVMAFHHPDDMQAFYRMYNVKRIPTRADTPWPNRAEMGVRLSNRLQKPRPDHSGARYSYPVDAQGSNGEKYTGDLKWQDAHGTGRGTQKPRDLLDPASMNPEQLTSTPTKQDLLKGRSSKNSCADNTHFEVQQREDIHRDLAERMKFVPPHLRAGEVLLARRSEQNPARMEIWHTVEGGNHCCQGLHGSYQYLCDHFSGKCKPRRPLDAVDLEELPDTRVSEQERLCCGSLVKVKFTFREMFSDI